jgi:hypothetical protein
MATAGPKATEPARCRRYVKGDIVRSASGTERTVDERVAARDALELEADAGLKSERRCAGSELIEHAVSGRIAGGWYGGERIANQI